MQSLKVCLVVFLFATALSVGCTQSIRRAALVPHQQPIGHSGSLVQSTELSLGTPKLANLGNPKLVSGVNAGVVIPRYQGQGGIRIPIGRTMALGVHGEIGANDGATALSEDQPSPKGDVFGTAVSLFNTFKLSEQLELGVGGQLWVYSIPFVEYRTCVDCAANYSIVDHKRNLTAVLSVAVIPTYKINSRVSVFGGLSLRNHPTIEKSSIEVELFKDDEEVVAGPFNAIGNIGADVILSEHVKLTGYLYQPIAATPVSYSLTAGLMLTVATAGAFGLSQE